MFTIHHGQHVTTLVDARGRIRYTIDSRIVDGWWHSLIRSVTQSQSLTGDAPDFWYEEVAKIEWSRQGAHVFFGSRRISVDSYLRKDTNSRTFRGPGDEVFRWKIRGGGLELYLESTGSMIATSSSPHKGRNIFSVKSPPASIDIIPEYMKFPRVLDKIVATWVILDGMMHDKDLNANCYC